MKQAAPEFAPFAEVLLLVCRDCQKRSSGPKKIKAKDVLQTYKGLLRAERPRPRVVVSSCLGLCPKRATAIARISTIDHTSVIGAVEALSEAQQFASLPTSQAGQAQ